MKDITNFLQNYEKKEAQFMKKETRSKGRKIEKLKNVQKISRKWAAKSPYRAFI
jgi:hypothetical protein